MSDSPSPETPFSANPAVHDPFQAAKASAMKAAEELRNAAAAKAQELRHTAESRAQDIKSAAEHKAEEIRERADQVLTDAKATCADLRSEAEKFARDKPLQALATAFGAGLLLGMLLRR